MADDDCSHADDLDTLRHIRDRMRRQGLELYAVFGNPVAHSLSPVMHNRAFTAAGYPARYAACRVERIDTAIAAVRKWPIHGASITIPHKTAAIDALDDIDEEARRIGAVNTVIRREGRLIGINTDGRGALKALQEHSDVAEKAVGIVGAGGAARAVAAAVAAAGARATVFNRTVERGQRLAEALGVAFRPLQEIRSARCDILINTTPVGMAPCHEDLPIPADILAPGMVVMDIVYNPLRTKLLDAAAAVGCVILDGAAMFVYQGALQFEAWTGRRAPTAVMRQAVLRALTAADPPPVAAQERP